MVVTPSLGITRTSTNLPLFQLLSVAGVAISGYAIFAGTASHTIAGYVPLAIAVAGALSYQWYIHIFSPYKREKSVAIVKGETLPELPLTRLDGSEITTSSFHGSKTLLVFFRANWCPFCMNQLKEVVARADRLAKSGVEVKFISNQGIDNSTKLAKDLNLPSHYEIYQDEELKAAKRLSIEDIGGSPVGMPGYPADTVMATVIALDEAGVVLFGDETDNYRRRPNPDSFLHVFEKQTRAVPRFNGDLREAC